MTRVLRFVSLFLLLGATSCVVAAESLKENNPEPVPGKQILMKADFPEQIGDARHYDDRVDASKTETIDFWFFMPSDDSAKTEDGYPLMIFLHGSGERGDNPKQVLVAGPPKFCADSERSKTWKFITISPQCKNDKYFSPTQMAELIERVCEAYPVDRSRIYATGLSMGGFGVYDLANLMGDKLAAIAPVAAWYDKERAPNIAASVWAFHGEKDASVKVVYGQGIVDAIKAAGNDDVQITLYPEVGHSSWWKAYDTPELYDWFLSHNVKK